MSEITQEQLTAEFKKLTELRQRTENLAEAMLEHITKFDDRVDSLMTQFEAHLDRTIDARVAAKVSELMAQQITTDAQDPDA